MENLPCSQESNASLPDIELSQDTMNQVLGAVGMACSTGEMLRCYKHEEENNEDPLVESSSISVRRAVFSHTEEPMGVGYGQPYLMSASANSSGTPALPGIAAGSIANSLPYFHTESVSSPEMRGYGSVSSPAFSNSSTVSPFGSPRPAPGTLENGCGIPFNEPMPGTFDFKLKLPEELSNSFQYSRVTNRGYIKMGTPVSIHFTFSEAVPEHFFIRAMGIHSAAEHISEPLICCAKHTDINLKKGLLFPEYFIRPTSSVPQQFCSHPCGRHSVATPISSLKKITSGSVVEYASPYVFPCFTSDFSKTAQPVELIFTLQSGTAVLGRCSLPVRVCFSIQRDKDTDEKRKDKQVEGKKSRKRGATELTTCTLPPAKVSRLTRRQKYTIETYPEVFPLVKVCVKMMEKAYQIPSSVDTPTDAPVVTLPKFDNLDSWLSHLGLGRYSKLLTEKGISELWQVLSVTEEDLEGWGMKIKLHRKKFLDGKELVPVVDNKEVVPAPDESKEDGAELSSSLTLTSSQTSTASIRRTQSFEVVEITVKKNLSSSCDQS